jgi:hypothetical protein
MATVKLSDISILLQKREIEKVSKIIAENELSLSETRWYLEANDFPGKSLDITLLEVADYLITPYHKHRGTVTELKELGRLLADDEIVKLSDIIINESIPLSALVKYIDYTYDDMALWSNCAFLTTRLLKVADNILGMIYEKKAL